MAIGSPVYLAIADDATIRRVIEQGRPGTAMPAFAQTAGGLLTDTQIDILVRGMRERWARPGALGSDKPPAYAASQPGDTARGHNVFTTFLFFVPWPGRPRRAGRLDRGHLVSCARERSAPAHRNYHRHADTGHAGLARQRARKADVRCRRDGCRRMARSAAAALICAIESSRRF